MNLYKIDFTNVEVSANIDKTIEHSFYVSEETYNAFLQLLIAKDSTEDVIRPDI